MKDLNKNLLRFAQREELKTDIEQAEQMIPSAKPEERGTLLRSIKRQKQALNDGSPEPLTGKEKDTLSTLEKRLRAKITEHMPTEEVMRKNPTGAVDWHTKWQNKNKKLVRLWKNVQIQLNPDSQDKDLANIERFRPSGQTDRMRTDAQIVGLMSYGSVPEENWPFDAPENTALNQAKKHAMTEEEAEGAVNNALAELDVEEEEEEEQDGRKKELSPEQHAILLQRLQKAREVKEQKRQEELQTEQALQAAPVTTK